MPIYNITYTDFDTYHEQSIPTDYKMYYKYVAPRRYLLKTTQYNKLYKVNTFCRLKTNKKYYRIQLMENLATCVTIYNTLNVKPITRHRLFSVKQQVENIPYNSRVDYVKI